jgi:hypothetical protein
MLKQEQTNSNKKKISTAAKLNLYKLGSIGIISIPLLVVLGINFNEYFRLEENAWKMGAGGILGLVIVSIQVFKKTKLQPLMWTYITLALLYFFQVIIADAILIVGAFALGKTVDTIIFTPKIARLEKIADGELNANIQKSVNKELVQEIAQVVRSGKI